MINRSAGNFEKNIPWTINDAVKYARMIEADQLRDEQWQEFDKEDKRSPRNPNQTEIR